MLIVLPSSTENRNILRDRSFHGRRRSIPKLLVKILRRPQSDMASLLLDIVTLRLWLTNSGKREAVQTVLRKKIGSVPPKPCAPVPTPAE